MAAERLVMRKAREILRQKLELGLSHRQVGRSLGVAVGTVSETLMRAMVAKLNSFRERLSPILLCCWQFDRLVLSVYPV